MSKQKMLAARELIQEKRYAEARALLKTIDDPKAQEWLKKLDEIAPQKKKSGGNLILVTTVVVLLAVVIIAVTLITRQNDADSTTQNAAAQVPTQMELPSVTPTFTHSPTFTSTDTPIPTDTPLPTSTNTPTPTDVPSATPTSMPTLTFTPNLTQTARQAGKTLTAIAQDIAGYQTGTYEANLRLTPTATNTPPPVGQIGPIYDDLYDAQYTVEVALRSVRFSRGEGFERPASGSVYLIIDITVRNLGPASLRFIGPSSFQVLDAGGAVRNNTYVFFTDCDFDFVDLTAGGSVNGCVAFEVPSDGRLEFIYAPYQFEGLNPGRYLSFVIRQ